MNNLVLITSVICTTNNPLSYINTRSIYSHEERFEQTKKTIQTIREKIPNSIFMNFYNNDFPIDDNCVVIYCEGTQGNPLNAKNVVRWMLSKLGQNVPYNWVDTWGKNELVYYFNSEKKIQNKPDKLGSIYKMLNVI